MATKDKAPGLPQRTPELITYLDKVFKAMNPSPQDSVADIMFKAGRRDIIEWLKAQQLKAEETVI